MLKLEKPLASLDIESSGLSLTNDRIISLSLVVVSDWIARRPSLWTRSWLINPGFLISKKIEEMTGITNEMLKDAPLFGDVAVEIYDALNGCDLLGFCLDRFDVPILHEHFTRARIDWNPRAVNIIDVGTLFKIKEPRTLEAAVQKYCGREHIGAHDSENDARETIAVLHGMMEWYDDLGAMNIAELAAASKQEKRLDLEGKIKIGEDGRPAYAFGKQKDVAVEDDLKQSDYGRSFADWILKNDFTADTKRVVRELMEQYENQPQQQAL